MARPIFLVVGADSPLRGALEHDLRWRFGADYEVVARSAATEALAVLTGARAERRDVALIFTFRELPDMACLDFLAKARDIERKAKRVLLDPWSEFDADAVAVHGMTIGLIDSPLATPWDPAEENLYPLVSELLSDWVRDMPGPRFEAVRIVGEQWSARSHALRDRLDRSAVPYGFYAHDSAAGRRLLESVGQDGRRLPVVIVLGTRVLVDPSGSDVAAALGVMTGPDAERYDLVIVGAGPAGLSAAVYGASEGLRTLLVESDSLGGQAGSSSRIRNYLGFPHGISGQKLTAVATTQARLFGAELCYAKAHHLRADAGELVVGVGDGEAKTRAVVLATGVAYRRLDIPECDSLLGCGVFYGTAASEAPAMAGRNVFVVGGGNSAGQAALHLARHGAKVTMLVREGALELMSDYLIKEVEATPNVRVRLDTELVGAAGTARVETITIRDNTTGSTETLSADAVFVLIGTEPHTEWLAGCVARDQAGYIVTGRDLGTDGRLPDTWPLARPPFHLETSMPGVFAAGDIRHSAVKRVASAVGEGSMAVQMVHQHLQGA